MSTCLFLIVFNSKKGIREGAFSGHRNKESVKSRTRLTAFPCNLRKKLSTTFIKLYAVINIWDPSMIQGIFPE